MEVLIIGASGLLAKSVISQFNKEGFQLRLFSRTVNQSIFEEVLPGTLSRNKEGIDYPNMDGKIYGDSYREQRIKGSRFTIWLF